MEELQNAGESFELALNLIPLPSHVKTIEETCIQIFKKFKTKPEITAAYTELMQDNNYEKVSQAFFRQMSAQLEEWQPIFRKERLISSCLKKFANCETKFGINQIFVDKAKDFFIETTACDKITLITRFIIHLAEAFLLIGNIYFTRYGISKNWRDKHKLTSSRMCELLIESYRKYSRFYHHKIEEHIRRDMEYLASIDTLEEEFKANINNSISIHDSATRTIMMTKTDCMKDTMAFQQAYSQHDDQWFSLCTISVKEFYEKFRTQRVFFDFLDTSKKDKLISILLSELKKLGFRDKQKNELRALLTKKNMNLNIQFEKNYKEAGRIDWSQPEVQKTMVCLFLAMSHSEYTSTIRQYLRFVFRCLGDTKYHYSNFRVLVFLENLNLPPCSGLLRKMRAEKKVVVGEITKSLQQIKTKNRWQGKVPFITLEQIGKRYQPSRVITIFISGFTCQNQATEEAWKDLLSYGETYAMNWQSLTKGVFQIFKFNSTMAVAQTTGKYLAHLLRQNMQGYLVNLVGFSLGTEVIKQALVNMGEDIKMIYKLVFLGGVAHVPDLYKVLLQNTIEVINCYSAQDIVLKLCLPIFNRSLKPCGLNQVGGHMTTNVKTNDLANWNGHRITYYQLRKIVEFENDLLYLQQIPK